MLTIPSKLILIAVSAMSLSASAALAGCAGKRIDHPNGGPTFLPTTCSRGSTLGLYVNERGLGGDAVEEAKRTETRPTRINMGRGQYLETRTSNQ